MKLFYEFIDRNDKLKITYDLCIFNLNDKYCRLKKLNIDSDYKEWLNYCENNYNLIIYDPYKTSGKLIFDMIYNNLADLKTALLYYKHPNARFNDFIKKIWKYRITELSHIQKLELVEIKS